VTGYDSGKVLITSGPEQQLGQRLALVALIDHDGIASVLLDGQYARHMWVSARTDACSEAAKLGEGLGVVGHGSVESY